MNRIVADGAQTSIEGWAPWRGENLTQGFGCLSSHAFHAEPLLTVSRPDVAESMADYSYVKADFQLRLTSVDGRPVAPDEILLIATGTFRGDVRLSRSECPVR